MGTPRNRDKAQKLLDNIKKPTTTRWVFRKVVKVMGGQAMEITILKQKVRALEKKENENLRTFKRRKKVKKTRILNSCQFLTP